MQAEVESPMGCVCGDFNMMLSRHERAGSQISSICMKEFKEVMERLELVDLSLTGGKWTWFN